MEDIIIKLTVDQPDIVVNLGIDKPIVKVNEKTLRAYKGKSAYEYAVEGGYTGTESEFTQDLGDIATKTYVDEKCNTYIFEQGIASNVWTIQHNLNKYPSVTVVDSAGDIVWANPIYIDENNLRIEFSAGFVGKAYLN